MNQNNNSEQFYKKVKDPRLMFRYAGGLGDFIACILHSKMVGWLTKILTGKTEPCQTCAKRIHALNTICPIPFWRLFFKTQKDFVEDMASALQKAGFEVNFSEDGTGISASKVTYNEIKEESDMAMQEEQQPRQVMDNNPENYRLVTSGDNFVGEFMIRTQIFKRND